MRIEVRAELTVQVEGEFVQVSETPSEPKV